MNYLNWLFSLVIYMSKYRARLPSVVDVEEGQNVEKLRARPEGDKKMPTVHSSRQRGRGERPLITRSVLRAYK
jgi:hypothetical protein